MVLVRMDSKNEHAYCLHKPTLHFTPYESDSVALFNSRTLGQIQQIIDRYNWSLYELQSFARCHVNPNTYCTIVKLQCDSHDVDQYDVYCRSCRDLGVVTEYTVNKPQIVDYGPGE